MKQQKKSPGRVAAQSRAETLPLSKGNEQVTDTTTEKLKEELEHIYSEVVDLTHMLYTLDGDLDRGLDHNRGKKLVGGLVQLLFPRDSLEATQWISGRSWLKARELRDRLESIFDAMASQEERAA